MLTRYVRAQDDEGGSPMHEDALTAASLMAERASAWSAALSDRRSRRSYDGRRIEPGLLERMRSVCEGFRPYADARVLLVEEPEVDVFNGVIGSYGKVVGAPSLLLFIGARESRFHAQHVGYTGEAIVLEATALGLNTCWVGGFFDRRRAIRIAHVGSAEQVLAVSPLGYSQSERPSGRVLARVASAHRRKSLDEIAPGHETWPDWAQAAVAAARLAPSAVNRQPWRFRMSDGGLVISKDSPGDLPRVDKRLDCGIAMLHAEVAARCAGVSGMWTDLAGKDVARFDVV